ncbi:MAG: insulysin [Halieaceae bacterium]|jgi:insulysin
MSLRKIRFSAVFAAVSLQALFLAACSTAVPLTAPAPLQSPNDTYGYRLLTLDNGLKTLLISDPDTPKSAASLDVQVGSGDNPADRGGLAHFLEHMLFLGTKKYPDAAEYERFITEHGGSRNAYTSFEHTNYFFDVDAAHLPGALDRFAQFFIAPNFDGAYVERERNAVEAEYQMGLKSDSRRGLDVLQASMNPEHPYSRFAVGSLDSLADRPNRPVRDDLIAFYEKHYSANVMRLAVLGSEPLDLLEKLVRASFSEVKDRQVELEPVAEALFVDAQLPMLLRVKPQGTLRQLELNFPIADYRALYDAKPMVYVSNLVGHEGEGSLLSQLKRAGLAEGLSSGSGLSWRGGALFSVTVSLTEQGVTEYESVLQYVFAYLDMLRDVGPQAGIYSEQAALGALAFRFREASSPIGYVSSLTNSMHYYADRDLLAGPYQMERFDPALISAALDGLRPSRAQVVLTAPEVSVDRESPYYGVPYAEQGPEALMVSRWQSADAGEAMSLPVANPFIAEDVALLPITDDSPPRPELLLEAPRKRIWYQQAAEFRVPKGALYLSFRSPLVAASAEQRAAALLYTRMVTDGLNEYTYPAMLAGLGFNFYRHAQGISMRISGYSDKQLDLLEELLASIAGETLDEQRFLRLRRDMVLELQNTVARRPTSQLMDDMREAMGSGEYSESAMMAALESMSLDTLVQYRGAFWSSARAEGLLYGNFASASVERMAATLDGVLGAGAGQVALAPEVLAFAESESVLLESTIEHDDAVVAWYLQGAGQEWSDRAAVALTAQVLRSGFFQQLRTEQQLGYVVSSFPWMQYDVPGLLLLVQSPSHSAAAVQTAMDRFLKSTITEITEEQFVRHREALTNDILKPHKNLGERAEFYWQAIASRKWHFDSPQRMAEAVNAINFEDWGAYYREHFLEARRSLLAFSAGAAGEAPLMDGAAFSDPAVLREDHARYQIDLAPL